MKLYHGSIERVETPEIREPNRTLDYGAGFYLTSSHKQAEDWVRRKFKGETTRGWVNIYEYDVLVNQILIHTEAGLRAIHFINAEEIVK